MTRKNRRWTAEDLAALERPVVKTAPAHRTRQAQRKAIKCVPSEFEECRTFVAWCKLVIFAGEPLFERVTHVANERDKPGARVAMLVAIGVKAGYPDYVIDAPYGRFHGCRIEAKREHGVIDPQQTAWRDKLVRWDYFAAICEGHREMISAVRAYMHESGATSQGAFIDNVRFSL